MKTYGFETHHHYEPFRDAPPYVLELAAMLELLLEQGTKTMTALTDLQTAVAAEDTVIASAVTLLNGIPALIAAAGTDPTALAALTADITTQTQALAAAIVAGTPAAPSPVPTAAAVAAAPAATASTPATPAVAAASPAKTS